ncbi:hypothetical protein QYF61_001992 [Mycteria americana]|uniref:Uncharacterized protein n=1 Tax=Mycteria americana TaxID=33587 RepID=A0AAN7N9W6_MYCAM|nr:hypothetical protein QYF61_001992 [Mycteria americana]
MGPLLQLVQVPLDGILSLRHVNHTTQLGIICKLAEDALDPTVYVVDEDIKHSNRDEINLSEAVPSLTHKAIHLLLVITVHLTHLSDRATKDARVLLIDVRHTLLRALHPMHGGDGHLAEKEQDCQVLQARAAETATPDQRDDQNRRDFHRWSKGTANKQADYYACDTSATTVQHAAQSRANPLLLKSANGSHPKRGHPWNITTQSMKHQSMN